MQSNLLKITIKTPTSVVYSGEAISVNLPTSDGHITVLANHENLITTVVIGVIKIETSDHKVVEMFSYDGVVVIESGSVNILTQAAHTPDESRLMELEKAIESAKNSGQPGNTQLTADLIRAEKELRYHLLKGQGK